MRVENRDTYHQTYQKPSQQVMEGTHKDVKTSQKVQDAVSYEPSVVNKGQAVSDSTVTEQASPISILRSVFEKGKTLWLRIWGTSKESFNETLLSEEEKLAERPAMNGNYLNENSPLFGETGIKTTERGQKEGQVNPYFVVQDEEKPKGIFQRFRMRVETATGFLAKKFPFAQTGSFQTKQEQSKEDLRKKSKYRKDDMEVDCILTDDSYLLDSYNKKGEYSKMNVEK